MAQNKEQYRRLQSVNFPEGGNFEMLEISLYYQRKMQKIE